MGVTVAAASLGILASENTLAHNARWECTKRTFEKPPMGAKPFVLGTQALARGRLNLGAWHGFHEVSLKKRLVPREIDFRFMLQDGAYVNLVFGRGRPEYSAVRLSVDPLFENAYLQVRDDGAFLEKQPFNCSEIRANTWNTCRLRFHESGALLTLNDSCDIDLPGVPALKGRVGFHGGLEPAFIDDVKVIQQDGAERVRENFSNRQGIVTVILQTTAALAAILIAYWMLMRFFIKGFRDTAIAVVVFSATLTVVSVCWSTAYGMSLSGRYLQTLQALVEPDVAQKRVARARKAIRARHAVERAPNTTRILFLGSSQTWGEGATRVADGYVPQSERRLNTKAGPNERYECINAGIQGLKAEEAAELYKAEWLAFQADLVIVNLSNNDKVPMAFEQGLTQLAELNKTRGIKTLFCLEPNSIEHAPNGLPLHAVMRQVAEAHAIEVVDLHGYLAERYDNGFVWWDNVHPSSYGHGLIADFLCPKIKAALGASSGMRAAS